VPINIPNNLPATEDLQRENIFFITDSKAAHQDIRPLKIAILNLMPKKIVTETQILRLLSNSPIQLDIEFLTMATHISKNCPISHLAKFYTTIDKVCDRRFDGLIITGAPVEHLEYEQVDYWDELCRVMEWSKTNVYSVFHICWAAQAGLYYHYGIPKYSLGKKMFGIYSHSIEKPNHPIVRGFDETFHAPHSRHTEVRREDIEKVPTLEIITSSSLAGVHIVADTSGRQYFVTGHSEYDRFTLRDEYFRDVEKGLKISKPYNYFPYDDEEQPPYFNWRSHANLMFSNWVNCVYQDTPYNLDELTPLETPNKK